MKEDKAEPGEKPKFLTDALKEMNITPPLKKINFKIVMMSAESLELHPIAHRHIIQSKLKRLIKNMRADAIGVVHAVYYPINGRTAYWLLDGYHRCKALMDRGEGKFMVPVMVHVDVKTDADAAQLFLDLMQRSALNTIEEFENQLTAGFAPAVGAATVALAFNLKADGTRKNGNINCVGTLRAIWLHDQGETLTRVLFMLTKAWGRTSDAVEGKLVEGAGVFLRDHWTSMTPRTFKSLIHKLSKYPSGAPGFLGTAKGMTPYLGQKRNIMRNVRELLLELHDKGLQKGRLRAESDSFSA